MRPDTYVFVADSEKVLLLRNAGDDHVLDLQVMEHVDNAIPPTRELGTDRPGRYHAPSGHLGTMQSTNWHDREKTERAHILADCINAFAATSVSDGIVVVADASTLGEVRPRLDTTARHKLVGELDRDLTNHPLPDIERALKDF